MILWIFVIWLGGVAVQMERWIQWTDASKFPPAMWVLGWPYYFIKRIINSAK